MNCTEIKIWMDKASAEELKKPLGEIKKHIDSCADCKKDLQILNDTFNFIEEQKNIVLSQSETNILIQNLIKENQYKNKTIIHQLSKVTAAAIIVLGLITGILAGSLLSSDNSDQDFSTWNNEFSMLSDNSDYESYLFD